MITEESQGGRKDLPSNPELLGKPEFIGISGMQNYLICFANNRKAFLETNGHHIAEAALKNRIPCSSYSEFGLEGIDTQNLRDRVGFFVKRADFNYIQLPKLLHYGEKDRLIRNPDNPQQIAYVWLPSVDSTGDHRTPKNILVAKLTSEKDVERLTQLAISQPASVYDLLIRSYYPNSLIPLSDDEILAAVDTHAKEIIRLAWQNPDTQALCEKRRKQPHELIAAVQPHSVLKRKAECKTVEVIS